ncbi:MAG: hypothetical protein AAF572_27940 [Cyanobacteria bacterium P01_B01_bin.77]
MLNSSLSSTLKIGFIASALALGMGVQADAAELTRSWQVVEAASSEYNNSGGHAFWLPEMISGGKFVFDSEASLNEYDDGTAHLFGSIVAANDANKQWDFDIWFEATDEGTGGPKKELNSAAYVENGGSIDTNTWAYYDFSDSQQSTLTADSGTYAGQTLVLSDFTDGKYPLQIGLGANGKNLEMGFSTWFQYEGDQNNNPAKHADINVSLVANTDPDSQQVPEPAMGLVSLGLIGVLSRGRKKDA